MSDNTRCESEQAAESNQSTTRAYRIPHHSARRGSNNHHQTTTIDVDPGDNQAANIGSYALRTYTLMHIMVPGEAQTIIPRQKQANQRLRTSRLLILLIQ
jgi:hypothetical protein